jgi:flagellar basal-body rod protein FlgB
MLAGQGAQEGIGMGMAIETRMGNEVERYLDLATEEAKLTAENMANVDTPGYRTVGMDFEAEMREAVGDVDRGRASRRARVSEVDGLVARPDGNNVSVDRESLRLAEAQLKFKTGVTLLRQQYQSVMDAIHADK